MSKIWPLLTLPVQSIIISHQNIITSGILLVSYLDAWLSPIYSPQKPEWSPLHMSDYVTHFLTLPLDFPQPSQLPHCNLSPCSLSHPIYSTIPASLHSCSQAFLLILKQTDYDAASCQVHLLLFAWKTFLIDMHMASFLTFLRSLFQRQHVIEGSADYLRCIPHTHHLSTSSL